jgi:methyl-accepting chemotaxis protein
VGSRRTEQNAIEGGFGKRGAGNVNEEGYLGFRTISGRLQAKVFLALLGVFFVCFLVLYNVTSGRIKDRYVEQEHQRSEVLSESVRQTLYGVAADSRPDMVRYLVQDLRGMAGVVRLQIIRGRRGGGALDYEEAFRDLKTLDEIKGRIADRFKPEWLQNHENVEKSTVPGTDAAEFKDAFKKYNEQPDLPDDYYWESSNGKKVMTHLKPLPNLPPCYVCHGPDRKLLGVLMISTQALGMKDAIQRDQRYFFLILAGGSICMIGLIQLLVWRIVIRRIQRIGRKALQISEGETDLTMKLEIGSFDEVGWLGQGFNQLQERLLNLIMEIKEMLRGAVSTTQKATDGTHEITEGAEIQITATESTSVAVREMSLSFVDLVGGADKLSTMSDESSAAIQRMSVAMDEITRNSLALSDLVDETIQRVKQVAALVYRIDASVKELSVEARETGSSTEQMDTSIKKMREDLNAAVKLAVEVSQNAEDGLKTVGMAQDGMFRIKDCSDEVAKVIFNLQRQTESIGEILNVIDNLADQTSLLSLNASIIAAQAGERGKGFAVVANEIKELADRTASSTGQIHDIISTLQQEGKSAVKAIEVSRDRVQEGMKLSESSGKALAKIVGSINRSRDRILPVAEGMEGQSARVQHVARAMQKVNETVQQIAEAARQQSQGAIQMTEAMEKIGQIAKSQQTSTFEHSQGMKLVNGMILEVHNRAKEISRAAVMQKQRGDEITGAVDRIRAVTFESVNTVGRVGYAVEEMIVLINRLEQNVLKFKLGSRP